MNKNQQYRVEIQRLNGEVTRLEQLLETANSDARNLLSRTELQQTLEDIHTAANSFMSHLKTKMDEMAFADAYERGRKLKVDEVIALALETV